MHQLAAPGVRLALNQGCAMTAAMLRRWAGSRTKMRVSRSWHEPLRKNFRSSGSAQLAFSTCCAHNHVKPDMVCRGATHHGEKEMLTTTDHSKRLTANIVQAFLANAGQIAAPAPHAHLRHPHQSVLGGGAEGEGIGQHDVQHHAAAPHICTPHHHAVPHHPPHT